MVAISEKEARYLAASQKVEPLVQEVWVKFATFHNSRKWKNYIDLLYAFADHMGMRLLVAKPDIGENKRIGGANGRDIIVREKWGFNTFYFSYFHELAHNLMHFLGFEKPNFEIPIEEREMEADIFALFFCIMLFPKGEKGFTEIARNNPCIII